ncbi:MAG: ATP-binding protein [Pseudonocardiales bacterium]|nr:ATP-binding protein [Pseudonocardiales bacterium]
MPTVEIRFSPLPAHVRTARLMAVAVARRSHVDDSALDELRLAVGEACSRAVRLHQRHAPGVPVLLSLSDDDGSFAVDVVDEGPYDAAPAEDEAADLVIALGAADSPDDLADGLPSGVVLAVIAGLVDSVTISPGPGRGTRVHMQWPAGRKAADTLTLEEHEMELDLPV